MSPTSKNDTQTPRPDLSRPQYYRSHAISKEEEIVISGMSGRFPCSENIAQFANNLYNKVNMLEDSMLRWKKSDPEIPKRCGWTKNLEKFDANFFGVHAMQAQSMDPQCRLILEEAVLAVMDAGVNPSSLRGSKTGVYIASCFSESEKHVMSDPAAHGSFGMTGCSRAMYANRISYSMGLMGPSLYLDTACSSSMYGLDLAYNALRNGEIDAAIVGGTNLILHPNATIHFSRLGVLSQNGDCAPFDQKANGYVRSEGVAAIFLQRRRDARRIYCTFVHSKANCDGYKQEGITYPSGKVQEALLKQFYQEIEVSPNDLGYMEAHSTGTKVGDPEECRAIDLAICKQRKDQLLIGSVKSNIGHTEPTSGICSVIKVIIGFQNNKIPPNINFTEPRKEIEALIEGRMKVVSEATPFPKPYVGVNSFGFGGANVHVLLKQYEKKKVPGGVPEGCLPILCLWSGRTKEAVEKIFNKLEGKPLDPEFIALLRNIQEGGITGMVFRGFNVLSGTGTKMPISYMKSIEHFTGVKRPIVWVFSGMGSQWSSMGSAIMKIPQIRQSIQRCYYALKPAGVDLIKVLTEDDPHMFDNILHSFIGIAAIQIALVDFLKSLGLEPDYIIGHSVGELGCAYADGCFTAEQMILAAYYRGKVSIEKKQIKGSMAAIGMSYKEIRDILPNTIEVACHNSSSSCTISGPAEDVAKFVDELKAQNVFAREVPCSNIAYHTRYIAHLGTDLLKYLKHIIPKPQKRSKRWLSSSVPQMHWSRPESQLSSAEYHTNNLLGSVLFEETAALLPQNALTIEIAPHGLLQSILKSSIPNGVHVGLTQRNNKNNDMYFLSALGNLYTHGLNFPIESLHPKVEWPVSLGTDTISDIIEWDHRADWDVINYNTMESKKSGEKNFFINMKSEEFKYLEGHNLDGKLLIPATFYLECVWKTFVSMNHENLSPYEQSIEMENIRFVRATTFTMDTKIELTVMIHLATGNFEVTEGDSLVASGTIRDINDVKKPKDLVVTPFDTKYGEEFTMASKDFYKELKLRGYYYSGGFKSVESIRGDTNVARIKWNSNWVTFMDCVLQTQIIRKDSRDLCLPTKIEKLRIFGRYHLNSIGDKNYVDLYTSHLERRAVAGGIEIIGLEASTVQRRKPPGFPVLERYQFVSHFPSPALEYDDIGRFLVQLFLENDSLAKMKIVEIIKNSDQSPMIINLLNAIEDLPLVTGEYTILSSNTYENLPAVVTVDSTEVSDFKEYNFIIDHTGENVLNDQNKISEKCYIALVVNQEKNVAIPTELSLIAVCPLVESNLKLMLLRNNQKPRSNEQTFLKISSTDTECSWVKKAQEAIATNDLILVSENDKQTGILGLTNCLRKEYVKTVARCIIIDDTKAPAFDPTNPFYAKQLALGLAINVFRNGQWGTYRHLQLKMNYQEEQHTDHVYLNILQTGDLSSLKWMKGYYDSRECEINIMYSSLNFKDIMIATGRVSANVFADKRLEQDCMLGMEYSGFELKTGKRIMGIIVKAAFSNYIKDRTPLMMEVPKHWSLEEAATVPVVYCTVYYAFFIRADIRKGKSILIHSGTGGVGLAAIRVALAYGLEVFTTVGSVEKKKYLLKTFPQLKESHIGNSRDTSFKDMVQKETNGKGVNFVLNSLAEEKLVASMKCLSVNGVFLEIGKFDLENDNKIGLGHFLKEISFTSVLLDLVLKSNIQDDINYLKEHMSKDIERGIVIPLPCTTFKINETEKAFRYLSSGKHIGKVIIKIQENENDKATLPVQITPLVYFSPELVYIVPGGLGGFGLELIDWMILRGARKIVISSSRGVSNGYQSYRLNLWKSYGCVVKISTANIATKQGCEALIRGAMSLGQVGGIFNLAVVLKDALFENQTEEQFRESLAPKAKATMYLDELSQKYCPKLQHFLIFSSVSCGRGNTGQSNYGMANSIMERIIENRVANGLPGKAIQWGAIGEVGLVAVLAEDKIDLEIGGTLQQRISSCLQELDTLLSCSDPVVASMVVAEKRIGEAGSESVLDTVLNIMSIRDKKSISYQSTLSELGMDSLLAVEIKQTLERNFDIFLSPQDVRTLTFQKLEEYSQDRTKYSENRGEANNDNKDTGKELTAMIRNMGDEANYDKIVVPLNQGKKSKYIVFFFSGIECSSGPVWFELCKHIDAPSYMIQLHKTAHMHSHDDIAEFAVKQMTKMLKPSEDYRIVGYSYGSVIVTKAAYLLEQLGHKGKIFLIDGSPAVLSSLYRIYGNVFGRENMDAGIFANIVSLLIPEENKQAIQSVFANLGDYEAKMNAFTKYAKRQKVFSEEYCISQTLAIMQRGRLVADLDLNSYKNIDANICLLKPTEPFMLDISDDYELGKMTNKEVVVKILEGNHNTILEHPETPKLINNFILCD